MRRWRPTRIAGTAGGGKALAARLVIGPRTVDFHLRHVFAKLGVSSRTEPAARPPWAPLREAARDDDVVLLFAARDAKRNNAVVLRDRLQGLS